MGETIEEAIDNAVATLHDWIEVVMESGRQIPARHGRA
jgi:predicted RNase H-like HicB family nuclease